MEKAQSGFSLKSIDNWFAVAQAIGGLMFTGSSRAEGTQLNVLFIGVDDLRPELNCCGASHIHSQNFDWLASEGVLFERAYCQWAVCMPSRASLLSGLRPDTRAPLIISMPAEPRGVSSESVVERVDLHPTLSELAGLPIHVGADRESFAENVRDPSAPGQTATFSQYPRGGYMGYSVRTASHRYTEWCDMKKPRSLVAHEFYKYDKNGIERENIADREGFAEIRSELKRLLKNDD